jgi:tetratricopeptide (TPR) repeat protein
MPRISLRVSVAVGVVAWAAAWGHSQAYAKKPQRSLATAPSPARSQPEKAASPALARSYALEANRDFKGAAALVRPLAEAAPKEYFLRVRLAYLELGAADYRAAADDYARAVKLDGDSIEAMLGHQQSLVMLADYKAASAVGLEIVRRDPLNYLANSRLAWSLFNLKQYGKSAETYAKLVALYPTDTEMLLGLGYAQLRAGTRTAAKQTFQRVLTILPGNQRALAGLSSR